MKRLLGLIASLVLIIGLLLPGCSSGPVLAQGDTGAEFPCQLELTSFSSSLEAMNWNCEVRLEIPEGLKEAVTFTRTEIKNRTNRPEVCLSFKITSSEAQAFYIGAMKNQEDTDIYYIPGQGDDPEGVFYLLESGQEAKYQMDPGPKFQKGVKTYTIRFKKADRNDPNVIDHLKFYNKSSQILEPPPIAAPSENSGSLEAPAFESARKPGTMVTGVDQTSPEEVGVAYFRAVLIEDNRDKAISLIYPDHPWYRILVSNVDDLKEVLLIKHVNVAGKILDVEFDCFPPVKNPDDPPGLKHVRVMLHGEKKTVPRAIDVLEIDGKWWVY